MRFRGIDSLVREAMNDDEQCILVTPDWYREIIKIGRPSVFALYDAAWRAGYTVNGIRPERLT